MDSYNTVFFTSQKGININADGLTNDDEHYYKSLQYSLSDVHDWMPINDGQNWIPINNANTINNYKKGPVSWFPSLVKIIQHAFTTNEVSISDCLISYNTDVKGEQESGVLFISGAAAFKYIKIIDTRVDDEGEVKRVIYKYKNGKFVEKKNNNDKTDKYDYKLQKVSVNGFSENNTHRDYDYTVIYTGYTRRIIKKINKINKILNKKYGDEGGKVAIITADKRDGGDLDALNKDMYDILHTLDKFNDDDISPYGTVIFEDNNLGYDDLIDVLRDLEYCSMFKVNTFATFILPNGKHICYVGVDTESG